MSRFRDGVMVNRKAVYRFPNSGLGSCVSGREPKKITDKVRIVHDDLVEPGPIQILTLALRAIAAPFSFGSRRAVVIEIIRSGTMRRACCAASATIVAIFAHCCGLSPVYRPDRSNLH